MENNDILKEWVSFSKKDLETALFLSENMRPRPLEIICFHCQQAAEKALKAFILANNIMPPKSHELNMLCDICKSSDNSFSSISDYCGDITLYGVQPRYPHEMDISDVDTDNALKKSKSICDFVFEKLDII